MAERQSIRGAGTDRSGANDTTMLIWKVIAANPGITRDEILEKIEHDIPAGWAKRRYASQVKVIHPDNGDAGWMTLRARRFVLTHALGHMRANGSIAREGERYRTLREIRRYRGDPAMVDGTGTVAAEHLNDAYALRTAEAWIARGSSRMTAAEREAVVRVIRAFRRAT